MDWTNEQRVRERGIKECMEGRREERKKEEKRQRGAEGNKGGRFKKREICLLISLLLKVKYIIDKLCTLLTKS